MRLRWQKFYKHKSGATAIEYGLIAALIAIVSIATLRDVGDGIAIMFETVNQELIEPDFIFSAGAEGVATGNKIDGISEVANAKFFEPHKLIDGINSQEGLMKWLDTNNYQWPQDDIIGGSRVGTFLSDMSIAYGADMTQDLSSYGSYINQGEFNQIMNDFNDTRRGL